MQTVVLIVRGCPAGWLGAYGNEWVVTPHLDRLASEAVVFDRHISDCPDPVAACRAWLGGEPGVLEQLRASGVPTILVRANHPDTDLPDWFYAGWREVFDFRPRDGDKSPLGTLVREFPTLLDRLKQQSDYLLWIEIDRLLPPWDVSREVFEEYVHHELPGEESPSPEENPVADPSEEAREMVEASRLRSDEVVEPWRDPPTGPVDEGDPATLAWLATSFGSVVTMLDSEIGTLFDQLRTRGLDRSATWIVTSDYGYPLGGHGQIGLHRPWLHEEVVHLPLIVRLPGAAEAGRRVQAFTQPRDVGAAIKTSLCAEVREPEGLLGLARGRVEMLRSHAISTLDLGFAAERAIRTREWAYLFPERVPEGEARQPMLFQKPDDRWEVNDLRTRHIAVADELEEALRNG